MPAYMYQLATASTFSKHVYASHQLFSAGSIKGQPTIVGEKKPLSLYLFLLLAAHFQLGTASQENYVSHCHRQRVGCFVAINVSYRLPIFHESAMDFKPQAAQDHSAANTASLSSFTFSYILRKQRFCSICNRIALLIGLHIKMQYACMERRIFPNSYTYWDAGAPALWCSQARGKAVEQ